jgi:hypothetical protein
MKRLLAFTVAMVVTSSGCGYLHQWRCNQGWNTYSDPYAAYDEGAGCGEGMVYDGGESPVYLPDTGAVVGPEIIVPGETIPAPGGQPLPEPAP